MAWDLCLCLTERRRRSFLRTSQRKCTFNLHVFTVVWCDISVHALQKKTQDISLKERSWRCSQATFLCWRGKRKRSRSFFYSKNSWDFPITTWPRNLRETPRVCGGPVRLCHRGGEGNSAEPAKQHGGVSKADLPLTLSWGLWHSLAVLRAIQLLVKSTGALETFSCNWCPTEITWITILQ